MKFGVIPPYGVGPVEDPEFAVGFARAAEDSGFESLWVVEHVVMVMDVSSVYPYDPSGRSPFGPNVPQPDPLVWLSYVAAATKRIRLATGVLNLPQRNPLVLAKEAASLDRLSGGRLMLGIGVGWVREEAEALGTSFDDRGRRADEYVDVMRTLWRERVASFNGRFLSFEGLVSEPRPVQTAGVPIIVGGHSEAAARRAGRLGDGFYPLGVAGRKLAALREIMAESAHRHGRDPSTIELTLAGTPDRKCADAYRQLGADRMVVATQHTDQGALRRWLDKFRDEVMRDSA